MNNASHASIAIIDIRLNGSIAIESISVTSAECLLSGAWEFDSKNAWEIKVIISGRLLLFLNPFSKASDLFDSESDGQIYINDFLSEAADAVSNALNQYDNYKNEEPKKRAKLVSPHFYKWPRSISLLESEDYFNRLGMLGRISGTPEGMRKIIAASRLVQHFILNWQKDEIERSERKYLNLKGEAPLILPTAWQSQLEALAL